MKTRYLCYAVLLSAALAPLWSQDPRGRILGQVTDPSGAAVPGVEIRATNTATNITTASRTNDQGNYEISYLLPGTYNITAEAAGFRKYVRKGIELRVADRLTLSIPLQVGEVTEAVTVTGETPLLETSSASLGQVVDHRRLTELPLSGGNPFTLTRLTPGVINFAAPNHPSLAPAVEVISNIAVAGTRDHNTEYTIDGAPAMWGRNAAFVPPAEIVDEFKVQTLSYDAGIGHSPGGAVNVALRSGSNRLHASLFAFHNNNTLQGIDFFQRRFLYDPATGPVTSEKRKQVAPQHVINRFGATFSGPMVLPQVFDGKNKTFWMYGYEGLIRPGTERGNYFRTVPAADQRRGDFSQLLRISSRHQIYDPATIAPAAAGRFSRQPFADNIIPASRLDPMAQRLLQYWPESNVAGTVDGRNNFFRPLRSQNEYSSHTLRLDHNFNEKHRVFGRYNWMHQLFESGQYFPTIATGQERHRYNHGLGFDDVYMVSPQFLMNFRYGFSRSIQTFDPFGKGFDLAGAGFSKDLVAKLDPQGITFPQITVDQYAQLGGSWPSGAYTAYHTLALDLSAMRSSHSLRFGGEFRLYREFSRTFSLQTPRLDFRTQWTRGPLDNSTAAPIGQGLASYLLGIPSGGQVSFNASSAEQSTFSAFFVQDDWKLTPGLTLTLGVRYEYFDPVTERFDRSVRGFDFATPNPIEQQAKANYARNPIAEVPASQFRAVGGLLFAGASGQPRTLWNADRNNLSPRVGLAWTLDRATVIRAGYGIFFVPRGVDREAVNQSGYTQRTNLVPSTDNGLTFAASLANPFPGGILQPAGASGGLMTDVGRSVGFFNSDLADAYLQRWSFSVQRELPGRVLVETAYVGSRGVKLAVGSQLNPVPAQYLSRSPVRDQQTIDHLSAQVPNPFFPLLPGTGLSGRNVARGQLLRPYPHFTGISGTEAIGYSNYHSLQVRTERRFAKGFTVQANWTWSKFLEATGMLNESDTAPAKVISDQDRQHRFVASGIWELPFGRGKWIGGNWRGAADLIAGGWQLQAVYEGQSGAPIGFGNVIFSGDLHDLVLPRGERGVDRWFNTEAGFERDPARQLASNIRTLSARFTGLRAPGLNIWNASMLKNFRITERLKLQLRSEFLNALNHSHFTAPNTAVTNTLFGTITNTTGWPRQVYFAAKLIY